MNSILLIVGTLLLSMVVLTQALSLVVSSQKCGQNEEYTTCGSSCPPICDDLRYPLPKPAKACSMLCKPGCFCMKGYYRSVDSHCVLPEQCCGKNERYQTCGSACVETCNHKPTLCTTQCVAGCFCGCSDYIRQSNKTGSPCIHRDDCPKGCEEDNTQTVLL